MTRLSKEARARLEAFKAVKVRHAHIKTVDVELTQPIDQLHWLRSMTDWTNILYVKYNPDSSKRSVTVAKAFCGRLKKAVLFIILVLEEGTYARDPLGMVPTRCTS